MDTWNELLQFVVDAETVNSFKARWIISDQSFLFQAIVIKVN